MTPQVVLISLKLKRQVCLIFFFKGYKVPCILQYSWQYIVTVYLAAEISGASPMDNPFGSIRDFGNLPSYPSRNPTLNLLRSKYWVVTVGAIKKQYFFAFTSAYNPVYGPVYKNSIILPKTLIFHKWVQKRRIQVSCLVSLINAW